VNNALSGFAKFYHEADANSIQTKREQVAKNFVGQSSIYSVGINAEETAITIHYSDTLNGDTVEDLKKLAAPFEIELRPNEPGIMHES
jgi:hypothetical protein